MALVMKNGKKLNNFFGDAESIEAKKKILEGLNLTKPFFSFPKDKERLLAVIKDYIRRYEKCDHIISATSENIKPTEPVAEEPKPNENSNAENGAVEGSDTAESSEPVNDITQYDSTIHIDGVVEQSEYIDIPSQVNDIDFCTPKALLNIARILMYRSRCLKRIWLMKLARFDADKINDEIEKVVLYNVVLSKYAPILNKQEIIDTVNVEKAKEIFNIVSVEGYEEIPTQSEIESEIKKNKEDQDFDIVAALSYVGVSVDRDDYGYYSVRSYNNGRGIRYYLGKQEKFFSLSKTASDRFVNDFLNKPLEQRKFITPGQVFISYISEAEKNLGISTRSAVELDGIFGSQGGSNAKQYFKEMIKKYSRNSEEWKDYQKLFEGEYYANKEKDELSNKILIKQQAKKLVIADLFQEIVNFGDILSSDQLDISDYRVSDISRDFGLDVDISTMDINRKRVERIEDSAFRVVSSMHGILLSLRGFIQDIIDNYTVDYLRKEKIFLLAQDEQNEYIQKKKEYEGLVEKLSYDKDKDAITKSAYYQTQIDELTQKIGNQEYLDAKNNLLKTKNNFRTLLINTKTQKESVKQAISAARQNAENRGESLSIEEQVNIIKEVLSSAPDLIITFDKGKAVSWVKHKVGEEAKKVEEPLSQIDKVIEETASKISDESHQKILEENRIREKVKKAEKEERVKSVNAYINAYGSIVGNATGVGAYNGNILPGIPNLAAKPNYTTGPTFAPIQNYPNVPVQPVDGESFVSNPRTILSLNENPPMYQSPNALHERVESVNENYRVAGVNNNYRLNEGNSAMQSSNFVSSPQFAENNSNVQPIQNQNFVMPSGNSNVQSRNNNFMNNEQYANFDFMSDTIEPCIIPYIVGYENKNGTIYGNMLEKYAIMDRYKYLLSTNNNALYTYIENKHEKIQTPEQIIKDLYIRYVKNAMAKSGLSTVDSNLASFDSNGDIRRFLGQYVPQNLIDIVISDYNDLIETLDFDLLKDLIDHKFTGDLETYIPTKIKDDVITAVKMISTIAKSIMTDISVKKNFDAYSSSMKQSYINSLIEKIEGKGIPESTISNEEIEARILDYISFSVKAQNVIIQEEDSKNSGLGTYPRSIFFRQKETADKNLRSGKVLTYEQNEIITTRNEPTLAEDGNKIVNLFGTLYRYNGAYGKLLIKLKPFSLCGGVKFMENLVDALTETLDVKTVVINNEEKKSGVSFVKFASKEKAKENEVTDKVFNYEDENWFVRKGFVVDKRKVKEYYLMLAFGFKYGLDREKKALKKDFYENDILNLNKINQVFKDESEENINLITTVIRNVMTASCDRVIDYISWLNIQFATSIQKALYIGRVILQSGTFDTKTDDEKLDILQAVDADFNAKVDDLVSPHPEIVSTIEEQERYEGLYLYYALTMLFNRLADDKRFITLELDEYFDDLKRKCRNKLLGYIRDHEVMNGYEQDLAKYFELKTENMKGITSGEQQEKAEEGQSADSETRAKITNLDVIFKGIYDGFEKAIKNETNAFVLSEMEDVKNILSVVGTLPGAKNEDKELEIALPNNQTILCNVKGFMQQYLFRYIVDKEHELGPFAYVVSELMEHEEIAESIKNIEIVANKLNSQELGINLIAKFSTIVMGADGNTLKIGESISTVVETINRLKAPSDQIKALNRDVFYKDGVDGVKDLFQQYFSRLKLENMQE